MNAKKNTYYNLIKNFSILTVCAAMLSNALVFGQNASPPEQLKNIDSYIEKGMIDWQVPGLSIAVIKDDKIVYAKGYGVREIGKTERVDEKTLFAVGSVTKSFTAAGVGLLIDEKKIILDEPVVKYLPAFKLFDENLTQSATVRDLLAQRTGLPRANASLLIGYDRNETLRRMQFLKPVAPIRSQFTYQNQMYLALGLMTEQVAKTNWDDFVRQRLFAPLKMTTSNTSVNALKNERNVAQPHAIIQNKPQVLPYRSIDSYAPAGAINSNAIELTNWVRMFLNKGKFEDKQILSPQMVRIMTAQQTVIPVSPFTEKLTPTTHFQGYGMGWFVRDYRGRKVVEHGGNVDGMTAQIGMLPEENLGIVILSNLDSGSFPSALMYRVFDSFLGDADKQIDLSAEYMKLVKQGEAQQSTQEKELAAKRDVNSKSALPLEQYAGTYQNDLYGTAQVSFKDGKLYLKFNDAAQGELEHWEKDTFRLIWNNPFYVQAVGNTPITFQIENGKIIELKAQNLADYKRVAP
jgi:CubicO group peptidase (beta-lactamase class C family)